METPRLFARGRLGILYTVLVMLPVLLWAAPLGRWPLAGRASASGPHIELGTGPPRPGRLPRPLSRGPPRHGSGTTAGSAAVILQEGQRTYSGSPNDATRVRSVHE
jgi:hypothetical protein